MDDVKKFAKAFNQPTLKATPRNNSVVGFFADALKPVQQFASNYNIPQSIPLIGGQSVADITGLTGAQGLLEDVSYGAPVVRGGSFQTAQVDPRVLDVAGLVPTGVGMAKGAGMYGKSLAKEIGRNINEGTAIGNLLDPRMMVVKDPEMQSKAIEHFGVTYRPSETGFIMDDGTRLDFSGRHEATGYNKIGNQYVAQKDDYLKNDRSVDHRTTYQVQPNMNYGWDALSNFMDKTGGVRYSPDIGVSLVNTNKPSDEQIMKIVSDFRKSGNPLVIDVDKIEDGQNIHSMEFENPTFDAVKKWIDKVYK